MWKGFQKPKRLASELESLTEKYGRFSAQPFERGWGTTVGNTLRRALPSPGEAERLVPAQIAAGLRLARERVAAPKNQAFRQTAIAAALPPTSSDLNPQRRPSSADQYTHAVRFARLLHLVRLRVLAFRIAGGGQGGADPHRVSADAGG